jgi:hypothetical protein
MLDEKSEGRGSMFTIAQTRHLCVLCTESIEKDEIHYESGAVVKYKFHDRCYLAHSG